MRELVKSALHVLTVTAAMLFVSILTLSGALYGTGVITKAKIADVARVVDGKLVSPPETPDPAPAAEPKKAAEIASEKELQSAIQEWRKQRDAEEADLAARKEAIEAMQRELETVRAEIDARDQDIQKRVAAFEQQKAAEEAAAKDAGFQEAVKTYSRMDAKDTAKDLYGLTDDVIVRYLVAFKVDYRAEVLTEIQKLDSKTATVSAPGEPNRAATLIQMMIGDPAEVASKTVAGTAN